MRWRLATPKAAQLQRELVAYSRQVLGFVHEMLDIRARHSVQVIASIVDTKAPRAAASHLRKDYEFLFERYFYSLRRSRREIVASSSSTSRRNQSSHPDPADGAIFPGNTRWSLPELSSCPRAVLRSLRADDRDRPCRLGRLHPGLGLAITEDGPPRGAPPELEPYADKLHEMQFRGERRTLTAWRRFPSSASPISMISPKARP